MHQKLKQFFFFLAVIPPVLGVGNQNFRISHFSPGDMTYLKLKKIHDGHYHKLPYVLQILALN